MVTIPTHAQISTTIASDTVWTADKSPYILSSTQIIPQNVTLTIEPGVTVISRINWADPQLFVLEGNLVAVGTADAPITFECNGGQLVATIYYQPSAYFSFCHFNNCPYFWNSQFAASGHYTLINSYLEDSCWSKIWPSDNMYIEDNVFNGCSTFYFQNPTNNARVYVQNNTVIKDSSNLQQYPYMFIITNPDGTVTNINNETNMAPDQTIPPAPTPQPTPTNTPNTSATIYTQPTATITPTPIPSPSPTPTPRSSPLNISIISPAFDLYFASSGVNGTFSFPLVYETNQAPSWAGYSIDGGNNVTVTNTNTTVIVPEQGGSHNLTLYANDTFGNWATPQTVYYFVGTTPPESTTPSPSIPEFPILIMAPMLIAATAIIIVFLKGKKRE
jgi:hypothetical protein